MPRSKNKQATMKIHNIFFAHLLSRGGKLTSGSSYADYHAKF